MSETNGAMKILVTLLLVVIVILNFVSLVTPNWSVDYPVKAGLWQICTGNQSCDRNTASDHLINTVRAFAIISTLISLLPFILFYIIKSGRMWVVRACLILICVCCIINMISYFKWSLLVSQDGKIISGPNAVMSYSFYLQIVILILSILAFSLSFIKKKEKKIHPAIKRMKKILRGESVESEWV